MQLLLRRHLSAYNLSLGIVIIVICATNTLAKPQTFQECKDPTVNNYQGSQNQQGNVGGIQGGGGGGGDVTGLYEDTFGKPPDQTSQQGNEPVHTAQISELYPDVFPPQNTQDVVQPIDPAPVSPSAGVYTTEPPYSFEPTDVLNGPECECVPYYLCVNGTILQDGQNILDIRERVPKCENALQVCCNIPVDENEAVKPPPHEREGCGVRHPQGVGLRIKGDVNDEAQFGEFPWMIGILEELQGHHVYRCGGSLIHQQMVLTAAHCVVNKNAVNMYARAGEWDTQTTIERFQHQQVRVKDIIIHTDYHSGSLHNDVAVIYLEEPFHYDEHVDIVCLPKQDEVSTDPRCYASGWGKDKFEKDGVYQVILKRVELPMVPNDVCQSQLRTTRLGKYFKLHKSFVCAGGVPNRDTCKGDGGSPLVCPIHGAHEKYIQSGIVAWGIECNTHIPGVYVNVAQFRDWIDDKMRYYNLPIEYDA